MTCLCVNAGGMIDCPALAKTLATMQLCSGLPAPVLTPGSRSAFAVTVDHATNVGRYRVSFKNGDRVVPHVDHRHPGPTERTER